ncbi:WDR6 [Candida margitis]|uniref:WDR6 n=1 Tax=Candida margitis TaxID=1775924 RepID=UPI0022273E82|nr:WDR6 [Candida margitis]KAI5968089.1 WDR6 [Candida margitis]
MRSHGISSNVEQNSNSKDSTALLSPLFHYGPVTFIKLHKQFIFVGYGPILYIYRVDSSKSTTATTNNKESISLIFSRQVFKRNKIHHISVNEAASKIILSGGRSFAVLPFDDDALHGLQLGDCEFKERGINEWIITSDVLDDGTVLLLNSYNMVYLIRDGSKQQHEQTKEIQLVEKIHCGEKSILYSGSINVLDANKIYIAAGTVMNGVIIWDLHRRCIVHSLNDHEGSIFGVKIDHAGKYIISCSDDRSIKLYDLYEGKVVATGWGHGSRIWNLEFANSGSDSADDNGLKIMSIGEDCTLRIWQYDTSSDLLQPVKVIENCHRGKHVWSGDVDVANLEICCTGGADGRVRVHDLLARNQVTTRLTMANFDQALTSSISFGKHDCIRDYFELTNLNKLVCLTSNGYVLEYDYGLKSCKVLYHSDKLTGFGIVDGFNDANFVVVTDRGGNLTIIQYHEDDIMVSSIVNVDESMKITNLLTCSTGGKSFVLIESPNVKIPFKLHELNVATDDGVARIAYTWNIPKPEANFPITAMTIDITNNWIILASKKVSLYLVDLDDLSRHLMLKKVAMGDTVSSVSVLNSEIGKLDLLILARDGMYLIASITQPHQDGLFHVDITHANKLTRGFIEGGFFHNGEDLILYGFKSSYFYIWNETKQIEIMNEYCGGNGHRHFKFYRKTESSFSFIYSFKNDIYVCHYQGRFIDNEDSGQGEANFGMIHSGTHGREIRDVAVQNGQLLSDGSRLIISSAEDSTICLGKILPNGAVRNYWNMTNHISGMQTVGFLNCDYAFSSAANEEFIIWKVCSLGKDSTTTAIPTLRELARLKSSQDVPDLRVMDYDAVEYDEYIFVATVYSNSMIKLWKFEKASARFDLINEWSYATCCILHCQFFKLSNGHNYQDGAYYLLIATTDGNITVYDISDPKSPVQVCKSILHQSGVKAICLIPNDNGVYLITGSDDNALAVSLLTPGDNSQVKLQLIKSQHGAASATITSISHVKGNLVAVVSVDQMIRIWSFTDDDLVRQDARYTTVSDTGCCDVTTVGGRDVLVVGGAGLSTWDISPSSRD